jgi:hypothetical protein
MIVPAPLRKGAAKGGKRNMNEQGWRTALDYPDPGTAPTVQWAWEFSRRNQDYRKDYLWIKHHPAYSECPLDQQMAEWFSCDPPALPGESLDRWMARVEALLVPGQRYSYGFPASARAAKWGLIRGILPELLRHTDGVMQEIDPGESAYIIRALAGRCSSLAHATVTLLNAEDEPIRPEDLEAIEKRVTHG